jgi:hypothetical protein
MLTKREEKEEKITQPERDDEAYDYAYAIQDRLANSKLY